MKITEHELIEFIHDNFDDSGRRLEEIIKISGTNCVAAGIEIGYRDAYAEILYVVRNGLPNETISD